MTHLVGVTAFSPGVRIIPAVVIKRRAKQTGAHEASNFLFGHAGFELFDFFLG